MNSAFSSISEFLEIQAEEASKSWKFELVTDKVLKVQPSGQIFYWDKEDLKITSLEKIKSWQDACHKHIDMRPDKIKEYIKNLFKDLLTLEEHLEIC